MKKILLGALSAFCFFLCVGFFADAEELLKAPEVTVKSGGYIMYNILSPKAEEFIHDGEIRESLERFKQYRLDRGALLIRLPEVQIRVDEDSQIRICFNL